MPATLVVWSDDRWASAMDNGGSYRHLFSQISGNTASQAANNTYGNRHSGIPFLHTINTPPVITQRGCICRSDPDPGYTRAR